MKTVYVLIREDASHLGGPMGTEYTTPIGRPQLFDSPEKAWQRVESINKQYNKNEPHYLEGGFKSFKSALEKKKEWSEDLRCEIVTVTVQNIV